MKKSDKIMVLIMIVLFSISLACSLTGETTVPPSAFTETALSLRMTQMALDLNQMTVESYQQALTIESAINATQQALPPASENPGPTQPEFLQPPTTTQAPVIPTTAPPTLTSTYTETTAPTSSKLILQVFTDRKVFYCVPSSGPTTLTVTVSLSDVDQGAAVYWRLQDKSTGRITDWENEDLRRSGGNNRAFTFDANVWDGTNNFYYPPLMGESWFQYQIIADKGERTEVFSDVTFFPCAQ